MSLATLDLPSDVGELRALAVALQASLVTTETALANTTVELSTTAAELATTTAELRAAKASIQLTALEIAKLKALCAPAGDATRRPFAGNLSMGLAIAPVCC